MLVHGVVHHPQSTSGQHFPCPAERKRLAYYAQGEWFALFGETLATARDLDAAMLLVGTVCTYGWCPPIGHQMCEPLCPRATRIA